MEPMARKVCRVVCGFTTARDSAFVISSAISAVRRKHLKLRAAAPSPMEGAVFRLSPIGDFSCWERLSLQFFRCASELQLRGTPTGPITTR